MFGLSAASQRDRKAGYGLMAAGAVPLALGVLFGGKIGLLGRVVTIGGGLGLIATGAKRMVTVSVEEEVAKQAPEALARCMAEHFLHMKA